jgi:NADH-quinone oxidoreductase subunit N
MNLGAFGIVALIEGEEESNLSIASYAGLSSRKSFLAALMALFMFSLAGIPPFADFFGKYYIFIAAIKSNLTWLAIIGVVSSAISVYFYLRIVVLMYFKESSSELSLTESRTGLMAVIIASILVILIGIFPGSVLKLITSFI